MVMIKKIAGIFLISYLFIATASCCLVFTTYFLLGIELRITALSALVFFSTLLVYHFHKISTLFEGISFSRSSILEKGKLVPAFTMTMIIVAAIGMIISIMTLQPKTILLLIPTGLITFAYSVPVLKLKGKKKRLREIFLVKITSLAFIWSLITVTLPMVDMGVSVFTTSSIFIFTERFLFMYAICVPFEIRDMEQEKKWGNMTLPQRIGVTWCKITGLLALLLFMILVWIQFGNVPESIYHILVPQCITAIVAALLIVFSNHHRSKYYFRIFVDGTMQLQLILLLLFNHFG